MRRLHLQLLPAALVLLSACSSESPADGRLASVFSLREGDCLNDASDSTADSDDNEEVESVRKIDCAQPHRYETYHIHRMTEDKRPAEAAIELLADVVCENKFYAFVGRDYDDSELAFNVFWPSKRSWASQQDRDIVCMVQSMDGSLLVGSMRDSKR